MRRNLSQAYSGDAQAQGERAPQSAPAQVQLGFNLLLQ